MVGGHDPMESILLLVDHKPSQASDQSPIIWSLACMNRFRVSIKPRLPMTTQGSQVWLLP